VLPLSLEPVGSKASIFHQIADLKPASGIGKATALSYARYGARGLVVADLNEPGVRRTAEQAKQEATHPKFSVIALFTDVRIFEKVEHVFHVAVEQFGRIDYSVTTAGVSSI
jgi:NAD(P)-dependent dehydrogenase (short-subunit alcohol dehydrogenase family)